MQINPGRENTQIIIIIIIITTTNQKLKHGFDPDSSRAFVFLVDFSSSITIYASAIVVSQSPLICFFSRNSYHRQCVSCVFFFSFSFKSFIYFPIFSICFGFALPFCLFARFYETADYVHFPLFCFFVCARRVCRSIETTIWCQL